MKPKKGLIFFSHLVMIISIRYTWFIKNTKIIRGLKRQPRVVNLAKDATEGFRNVLLRLLTNVFPFTGVCDVGDVGNLVYKVSSEHT